MKNNLTLRFDDIGASSKFYCQHGKKLFSYRGIPFFYFPLANFWFFKRIFPFANTGPYEEITALEWQGYIKIFKNENIRPLIAITAAWVEKDGHLTPYPEKFPEEAAVLKQALREGVIEIANHGLTHCIVGKHLPQFLSSNREFHREFLPSLDQKIHIEHIVESQKILENYFEIPINIFVPPGNIWSEKTYASLKETNLNTVIADRYMSDSNIAMENITFKNDRDECAVFHDRDLKMHGEKWLKKTIKTMRKNQEIQ